MRNRTRIRPNKKLNSTLGIIIYSGVFFLFILFAKTNFLEKTQAQTENIPQNLSQELQNLGISPLLDASITNQAIQNNTTNIVENNNGYRTDSSIIDLFKIIEQKFKNDKSNTEDTSNTGNQESNQNNQTESQESDQQTNKKDDTEDIIKNTLSYILNKYYGEDNSYLPSDVCNYGETIFLYQNGGNNLLPEYLSGNTIYILQPGEYSFDYMLKIAENCTTIIGIGSTGEILLYTNDYQGATIKITSGQNNIIENITIEGKKILNKKGANKDTHTENNYGVFINTTKNILEKTIFFDQKRFAIYMDDFDNKTDYSNFYKTTTKNNSNSNNIQLTEYSATNEPVKIKKEKDTSESELLRKSFSKKETKFNGKAGLNLSESNGTVPVDVTLESLDESIKVDIPQNTIFKTENNEIYQGTILAPKEDPNKGFIESGSTLKSSLTIKVGSETQGLHLTNTSGEAVEAMVKLPLEGYKIGDTIDIYSSEDGSNWIHLGVFDIIDDGSGTAMAKIPTDHFSWISAGTYYGTYFKGSIEVTSYLEYPGALSFVECHGTQGLVSVDTFGTDYAYCTMLRSSASSIVNASLCADFNMDGILMYKEKEYNLFAQLFIPRVEASYLENNILLSPAFIDTICENNIYYTYDATPPSAPSMVAEPSTTNGTSNSVSSTTSTDAGAGGVQYEFCINTSNTTVGCISAGRSTSTAVLFEDLIGGQIYYYFVRSRDGLGNTTNRSASTSSTQIIPITIFFTGDTPPNNSYTKSTYFTGEADVTESLLNSFTWKRNGSNYFLGINKLNLFYSGTNTKDYIEVEINGNGKANLKNISNLIYLATNFDYDTLWGDTSTSVSDLSSYSNSLSISGTTWTGYGQTSGAYIFDGTSDTITSVNPVAMNFGTGEFSISLWFKTTEGSRDNVGDIVDKFNQTTLNGFHLGFLDNGSNRKYLQFGINSGNKDSSRTQVAPMLNTNTQINSMIVSGGYLYAATSVYGGGVAGGRLFRRNSGATSWTEVATTTGSQTAILSLAMLNGNIYGGTIPGGRLFRYNRTSSRRDQVATGLNSQTYIYSLVEYGGYLYGGTYPGGRLFRWNGISSWAQYATGLNSQTSILSLAVHNGNIYAGTSPNGNLFRRNSGANSWTQVASQLNSQTQITSLVVYNGKLYGGTSPNGYLFERNGSNAWTQVAGQLSSQTAIQSLEVYNGKLYGGTASNGYLFERNGSNAWTQVAGQLNSQINIRGMTVYNGRLYGGTSASINGGYLFERKAGESISEYVNVLAGRNHIVAVKQNYTTTSQLRLYFNNTLIKAGDIFNINDYNLSNFKYFLLGFGQKDYFNGIMDEVRIYKKALTTNEISTLNTGTLSKTTNTGRNFRLFKASLTEGTYSFTGTANGSYSTGRNYTIDITNPTFTFSNNSGPECVTGTLSITAANDTGAGLHDEPYSFDGTSWSETKNEKIIPAGQPGSQIATGRVRDKALNTLYKTATYTFYDWPPDANDFTGHASVGNTARTVNWMTLSSAGEGSCGTGSLSFDNIVQQGTKGVCSVIGDQITYTPNTNQTGSDVCVINIIDDEDSFKEIAVSRGLIDTYAPTSAPTCTNSAYFSGTINISCTVGVGGTQIRYTTNGIDPSPADNIRSNQSFSNTTILKVISCDELNNCNVQDVTTKTYTKDDLAPTTTISDTNSNWRNTDISTTLNGTDAGVGGVTTYYKTITGYDQTCTAGSYSTYSSAIGVSANIGETNQQTICYYSIDSLGNIETTQKQNYRIDKSDPTIEAPTIYGGLYFGNYFKGFINLRSSISDIGAGILDGSCMVSINDEAGLYWTGIGVTQDTSYCMYNAYDTTNNFDIKFLVKDEATNTGISNQSNFIYDGTAPNIGIPNIYAGTTYNNNYYKGTISIQSTVSDTGSDIDTSSCEYSTNNGSNWLAGSFAGGYCQVTNINPSTNITILRRVKDNLLAIATSSPKNYTYDNVPPTTTDNSTSIRTNIDQTITLSATDTGADVANTYYCITTSGGDCTANILGTSILVTGNNNEITSKQIKYYSTDNLNTDETIKESTIINIDKQKPTASLIYPEDLAVFDTGTISFDWTGSDGTGSGISGFLFELFDEANSIRSGYKTGTNITLQGLEEKSYTRKVTSIDIAGNTGSSDILNFSISLSPYVLIPNSNTSGDYINAFLSKGYIQGTGSIFNTELDTLIGYNGMNFTESISGQVCPETSIILQSTGLRNNSTGEVEFPNCFFVKQLDGNPFTGIISTPYFKETTGAFELMNNNTLTIFYVGTGQQIFFKDGNGDPINATIRAPIPNISVGSNISIHYSYDGIQRSYLTSTIATGINGTTFAIFETDHFTYFAFGVETGSFVINDDDIYTTGTDVTLNMSVPGATYMKFGNSTGERDDASWISYSSTYPWTLTGNGGDGIRTVYAMFHDSNGQTGYVEDTIILDLNAPTISLLYPFDGLYFNYQPITFTWTGQDNGLGISGYIYELLSGGEVIFSGSSFGYCYE